MRPDSNKEEEEEEKEKEKERKEKEEAGMWLGDKVYAQTLNSPASAFRMLGLKVHIPTLSLFVVVVKIYFQELSSALCCETWGRVESILRANQWGIWETHDGVHLGATRGNQGYQNV